MEEITLKIDGLDITAAPGTTILEAALAADIYIPHICHHPDLDPVGVCRLCMVEVEGRGMVISCRTPVAEGLVVHTESPKVTQVRRIAVELLIVNHHGDCLACAKSDTCELQRIANFLGIEEDTQWGVYNAITDVLTRQESFRAQDLNRQVSRHFMGRAA